MTMTLVSTGTVSVAGSTIVFTNIPQTGTDLLVLISGRSGAGNISSVLQVTVNGLTTAIYSDRMLTGNGSTAASTNDPAGSSLYTYGIAGGNTTANTFGNMSIYIPNYASAIAKSLSIDSVDENNAATAGQTIEAGLINTTAAITSITLDAAGGFRVGSMASLYTITKGSGGATVA